MKVVIIEDEVHTANLLREIIEEKPDVSVIQILGTVVDAVHFLSTHQEEVDLLFMDIQLADGKCFEIFKHLDIQIPTIFCTAYDRFTLDAFKNNGIDYILKPFKDQDVINALTKYEKLRSRFQEKRISDSQQYNFLKEAYQDIFLVPYRDQTKIFRIEEIALFYVKEEKVYLITSKNEAFRMFKNMRYLESTIDPKLFFRVNRQLLVNKTAVVGYSKTEHRKIVLQLNIEFDDLVVVSRLKVSAFKEWLGN